MVPKSLREGAQQNTRRRRINAAAADKLNRTPHPSRDGGADRVEVSTRFTHVLTSEDERVDHLVEQLQLQARQLVRVGLHHESHLKTGRQAGQTEISAQRAKTELENLFPAACPAQFRSTAMALEVSKQARRHWSHLWTTAPNDNKQNNHRNAAGASSLERGIAVDDSFFTKVRI